MAFNSFGKPVSQAYLEGYIDALKRVHRMAETATEEDDFGDGRVMATLADDITLLWDQALFERRELVPVLPEDKTGRIMAWVSDDEELVLWLKQATTWASFREQLRRTGMLRTPANEAAVGVGLKHKNGVSIDDPDLDTERLDRLVKET